MLVPYLAYRVVDPVSGAEVIPVLPHKHQSKWTIRALQPGSTGTTSIGEFEIPLFDPLSDGYQQAADTYAKLAYNQRVEAYLTPTGDFAGGQPVFSGIIRQLPRSLDDYSIRGKDSLQLLQLARTNRTEFFTGRTDQLAAFALRGYQLVFGDDLSAGVGAYTQSGGTWTAATDEGLPVATVSGDQAFANLLSPASAAANYTDCVIDAYFRARFSTTPGSNMRFGVSTLGSAAGAYGVVNVRTVTASRWEVDLEIISAATGNTMSRKSLALALPSNVLRAQIQLLGKAGFYSASTGVFSADPAGTDYIWRVTVNGVDGNCVWIQQGSVPSASVPSLYYAAAGSGASAPQLWATQFVHRNRSPLFQQGVWNQGAASINQYYSRTPNADLLGIATVTEGFVYRKTAKRGANQDLVDFAPVTGSQSGSQTPVGARGVARFEHGRNLKSVSVEPNSETPASDVSMQLSPGSTSAGQIEWHNVAAMKTMGVVTEAVSAQNVADFLAARVLAQQLARIKGSPGTAKKLTVLRDITTADLWRELDFIRVHAPRAGIVEADMQVLEYTLAEGSTEQEIVADAWPLETTRNQMSRMWQTLDAIASGTMALTPSSTQGLIYDSRFGTPCVLPAYGNDSLDSSSPFVLKFNIPVNVSLIQRVTLAFSLLAYRTYSTVNLSSTGGASVSHTHVMTHTHSHNHDLILDNATGGATVNVPLSRISVAGGLTDSSAISTNAAASSASSTGGQSADHTHTVSGTSVLGIQEEAVAQGVHVLIDGADVTSLLTPAGPYGTGVAADFGEIDVTPYVIGGGVHTLQMTSTTRGRISAQVFSYLLVKPF